jgi:hypothetical protein
MSEHHDRAERLADECAELRQENKDLRLQLSNALRDLAHACGARNRAVERAQELWDRLGGLLDAIAGEFERSVRHHQGPRGGQQVAFFGDFQSVGPSVVGRMEWWAREFRNALGAMSPVGSVLSDAKCAADAHAAEVEKFCEEGGEE